jgi:hypothetical protein
METKSVMILCNQKVANELIAQDENFKHVVVICPWMNDDPTDAVLAVDRKLWGMLVNSGEVYLREEVAGVKKNEDD